MNADLPVAPVPPFAELGLSAPVLRALAEVGYEAPSPIQAATIPPLLAGQDLVGQAQTGTGKTAAFALPILSRLDPAGRAPQALVLAPTRELAIQVAEAFQRYAAHLPGFHVLPVYGGQSYEPQLKALRRGVHVVVGTPGRLLDHMRRGTLRLDGLRTVVLDEADEMLRMGFIDDVEAILKETPPQRQVALFSATMPAPIRRIAESHLRDPASVTIAARTATAANIRQRYMVVAGMQQKIEALTRLLETEPFEAMLVFARTKQATVELADKLSARGFSVAALNGDVPQQQRERTVAQLKDGRLDIVVATDVAARGLDVERIGHVVNYDVPYDTESYVHRIGRTGRAGRSGEAILFVAPRERGLLRTIERATRQSIAPMELPSEAAVSARRQARFFERIDAARAEGGLAPYQALIEQYARAQDLPMEEIAAALARLAAGSEPLLAATPARPATTAPARTEPAAPRPTTAAAPAAPAAPSYPGSAPERPASRPRRAKAGDELPMDTYRIEVGSRHGVKAGNIVGAIANEAGLDSEFIGRVEILEDHSLVELPTGMPKDIFRDLQKAWVCGQQLQIRRADEPAPPRGARPAAERPARKPARAAAGASARPARPPPGFRPDRPGKPRPGKGRFKR